MNYEKLPLGYRYAGVMDFVRNRKLLLTVNGAALAVSLLMVVLGIVLVPFGPTWQLIRDRWYVLLLLAFLYFAYICLHELTHGVFMHALSGVKPKYGFQLCYAYAGSNVWFDRRSHIIIALAPLVIWGVILQILCTVLPEGWFWIFWLIQISNVSGAAGDVYCSIYLARFPGDILIQDTGTRMRIMRKAEVKTDPIEETKK